MKRTRDLWDVLSRPTAFGQPRPITNTCSRLFPFFFFKIKLGKERQQKTKKKTSGYKVENYYYRNDLAEQRCPFRHILTVDKVGLASNNLHTIQIENYSTDETKTKILITETKAKKKRRRRRKVRTKWMARRKVVLISIVTPSQFDVNMRFKHGRIAQNQTDPAIHRHRTELVVSSSSSFPLLSPSLSLFLSHILSLGRFTH